MVLNRYRFQLGTILLLSSLAIATASRAQDMSAQDPSTVAQPAPIYSQAQLDQMLAPIALYPDPLIGQILMGATYPLEVVEADRWIQNPSNAALTGDDLAAALEQQPWEPSVKALVPFPQVLHMMDSNIQWTEQLGNAFLAQQPAVMDSVQQLRQQAQAAGTLASSPQQVVSTQGSEIIIEPQNPNVVYVPAYNPTIVYGSWPYAGYPPYSFYPAGYNYGYGVGGGYIGFGIGIAVIGPLWGWDRWDWHHHRIDIDDRQFSELNHGRPPLSPGVWQHDPDHRHGVPYHDAPTRERFQGAAASPDVSRSYRGYSPTTTPSTQTNHFNPGGSTGHFDPGSSEKFNPGASNNHFNPSGITQQNHTVASRTPTQQQQVRHPQATPVAVQRPMAVPSLHPHAVQENPVQQHPVMQPRTTMSATPVQRPATPMFESFSRGSDVRMQSARGSVSRAAAPSPASAASPVHSGGEAHGGGSVSHNSGGGGRPGNNGNEHR